MARTAARREGAPDAKRLLRDDVLVLDVRPAAHYYREHIRGAKNAPAVPAMGHRTQQRRHSVCWKRMMGLTLHLVTRSSTMQQYMCELVVVYDSGGPSGDGPAFHLAKAAEKPAPQNPGGRRCLSSKAGTLHSLDSSSMRACAYGHHPRWARAPARSTLDAQGHRQRGSSDAAPRAGRGSSALWIGGARDAGNRPFLVHNAVSHILNCTKELPNRYAADDELDLHYLKLGLRDECEEDLASRLDSRVAFLAAARAHALERTQSSCDGLPADALLKAARCSCTATWDARALRQRASRTWSVGAEAVAGGCPTSAAHRPPRRISYPA